MKPSRKERKKGRKNLRLNPIQVVKRSKEKGSKVNYFDDPILLGRIAGVLLRWFELSDTSNKGFGEYPFNTFKTPGAIHPPKAD